MHLRLLLIIILVSSTATAQENLCNSAKASTLDKASGIVVQKVTLSGTWGSNIATVFLPNKEIADGAVLFSHSMIQSDNGASANMMPLALTLARAEQQPRGTHSKRLHGREPSEEFPCAITACFL